MRGKLISSCHQTNVKDHERIFEVQWFVKYTSQQMTVGWGGGGSACEISFSSSQSHVHSSHAYKGWQWLLFSTQFLELNATLWSVPHLKTCSLLSPSPSHAHSSHAYNLRRARCYVTDIVCQLLSSGRPCLRLIHSASQLWDFLSLFIKLETIFLQYCQYCAVS